MAPVECHYEIIDGPSRWDIAISLLDTGDRRFVKIQVTNGDIYAIQLTLIERIDQRSDTYRFAGHSRGIQSGGKYLPKAQCMRGSFSIARRQGEMYVRDQY